MFICSTNSSVGRHKFVCLISYVQQEDINLCPFEQVRIQQDDPSFCLFAQLRDQVRVFQEDINLCLFD